MYKFIILVIILLSACAHGDYGLKKHEPRCQKLCLNIQSKVFSYRNKEYNMICTCIDDQGCKVQYAFNSFKPIILTDTYIGCEEWL